MIAVLQNLPCRNGIYCVASLNRYAEYCSCRLKLGGVQDDNDSERGKLDAQTSAKFARQFVQLRWF